MKPLSGLLAVVFAIVGLAVFLSRDSGPSDGPDGRAAGAPSTQAAGPAAADEPAAATTVILVRHAETEDDGTRDPALSSAGRQRAEALAHALGGAGVDAIMSTPLRRTLATAQAVADRTGLALDTVAVHGEIADHAEVVASRIRAEHAGGVVLVAGHSNTVPAIARALTGRDVAPISEAEYDRLLVVNLLPDSPARVIEARYGPR